MNPATPGAESALQAELRAQLGAASGARFGSRVNLVDTDALNAARGSRELQRYR